jgi:hypothetical protein
MAKRRKKKKNLPQTTDLPFTEMPLQKSRESILGDMEWEIRGPSLSGAKEEKKERKV